jgi:GNAT superfamily N-acetyltransferase
MAIEKAKEALGFHSLLLVHEGISQRLDDDEEVTRYFHRVTSRAYGLRDTEEAEEEQVLLGKVEAHLMLGNLAENDRADIVMLADSLDQQAYDVAEILFGEDGLFFREPPALESFGRNAIYLHHIYVEPQFRGVGLGRILNDAVLDYHDPSRFDVAILFVNSQFELPKGDPFARSSKAPGDKKLTTFYKTLGFGPLKGRPGYMIRDLARL